MSQRVGNVASRASDLVTRRTQESCPSQFMFPYLGGPVSRLVGNVANRASDLVLTPFANAPGSCCIFYFNLNGEMVVMTG